MFEIFKFGLVKTLNWPTILQQFHGQNGEQNPKLEEEWCKKTALIQVTFRTTSSNCEWSTFWSRKSCCGIRLDKKVHMENYS